MTSPRLARAGLATRLITASLAAAALFFALMLAAASSASAVSREDATNKALAALGSKKGSDPVIVFGLTKPVSGGTLVTQRGTKKSVVKVGRERAFLFYEDGGPFELYPHPGRVALVGVKSGKVKVSKTFRRAPLVNGELPAFLSTSKRYRSSKYRVFYRLSGQSSSSEPAFAPLAIEPLAAGIGDPPGEDAGGPNSPPQANPQDVRVKQDFSKSITLTGSDDDDDLLTFEIVQPPDHGTLSGQPPDVVYTPDPGYLGKDRFGFKTNDSEATSNMAHVAITVVPLGLPPVVTASAGCTSYTQKTPAVVVDGSIGVTDPDDPVLDSARVRVSNNFQAGDVLLFTDQNGISSSYDDNTGVLQLTGASTVANYQTALRSVRYRNLASGNPTATKDIEFIVNDAGNDSAPATKQICITGGAGGTNDPPTGEPGEGGLAYTENDGQVSVDGSFVVGDPDSPTLTGATIKFVPFVSQPVDEEGEPTGPPVSTVTFAPAEDELYFVAQNGITGVYNDATGELTLSGSASIANYEAAIRSVTYENNSEDPSDLTRRLRFQVTDSAGANSVGRTRDMFITPVNDAPVVTTSEGNASATGENPAVAVDPDLTTLDVDTGDLKGAVVRISDGFDSDDELFFDDQLGISGDYDSGTGVLTLTGTASVADYQTALRSIEYRHDGNPGGSRTVEFVVTDAELDAEPNELDSAPATKGVDVNDKPVLDTSDTALSYTEGDGSVAVDSGITASDADSGDLVAATVQITSNFSAGEDELGFAEQNGISGSYDDDTGTLTLTGAASVAEYQAALGDVRYENSSEDPSSATRTVTFQADDGGAANNLSDPVTRDIEVTPVNDAPVVTTSAGSLAYTENDPPTAVDPGLTVSDVDDESIDSAQVALTGFESGDDLQFTEQAGISGGYSSETGVLTLTGPASVADYEAVLRSVLFVHSGDNPSASRTAEFTVNDGDVDSAVASKSIDITAVNDAPEVTTSGGSTSYTIGGADAVVDADLTVADLDDENLESATVTITGNFESGDNLVLDEGEETSLSVDYLPGTGVMTLTGPATVAEYESALRLIKYRYTGEATPASPKTVEFVVNDGDADSAAATKSIDVVEPNEAPVVTASGGSTTYFFGDTAGAVIDSELLVTDADDADLVGAHVQIIGFEPGDELMFTDQGAITGTIGETGDLSLSGTASVADYQAALRTVRFRHSGDNVEPSRSVEFTVNDGTVDSAAAAKTVDLANPPG